MLSCSAVLLAIKNASEGCVARCVVYATFVASYLTQGTAAPASVQHLCELSRDVLEKDALVDMLCNIVQATRWDDVERVCTGGIGGPPVEPVSWW